MSDHDDKDAELRRLVETSGELDEPFRYFMDHFADKREFIADSIPTLNDSLTQIIKKTVKHYFKKNVDANEFLILQYRHFPSLLHGSCLDAGFLIIFFFYSELNLGMAALVNMKNSGMTHYCRFRSMPLKDKHVNFHPGNPATFH